MAIVTVSNAYFHITLPSGEDLQQLPGGSEFPGGIKERTPELYFADFGYGGAYRLFGEGLTYDELGKFSGGVITGWELEWFPGEARYAITGLAVPAVALRDVGGWADVEHPLDDPTYNAAPIVFAGDDSMTGGAGGDRLGGFAGNDVILAGGGADTLAGGEGRDFLRGNAGNDVIAGDADFDDVNGNEGNDTCHGGAGDDWVSGGKDQDLLSGDDGADIVVGNLGNDTCSGDAGNDTVRGGQGDDSVAGGDGNDWLSGDLGIDTLSGGAGADVFYISGGAGFERVLDFNFAEGDRVQIDHGVAYSANQVGADVVISLSGGGRIVLATVAMSSLAGDWIFAS